jgi:hypothetical protein
MNNTLPLPASDSGLPAFGRDGVTVRKVNLKLPPKRNPQFLPALPMFVFRRLVRLPRRAWAVYLILTYYRRLKRGRPVELSTCSLADLGLDRHTKARALHHLERAGLIHVERRGKRSPLVTILNITELANG